jgi:hypothetical protein
MQIFFLISTEQGARTLLPANEHFVDNNPCHSASEEGAAGSHLRPCIMTKAASKRHVPLIALPCLPCRKRTASKVINLPIFLEVAERSKRRLHLSRTSDKLSSPSSTVSLTSRLRSGKVCHQSLCTSTTPSGPFASIGFTSQCHFCVELSSQRILWSARS